MIFAIGLAIASVALFVLGRWGRSHVDELLPGTSTREALARKRRQYRRGAVTCQVVAVLMFSYAVGRAFITA